MNTTTQCCDHDRRDFLKRVAKAGIGLGVMGLSLQNDLFLERAYGVQPKNPQFDACLQIFFSGGPSQTDTWDPKPGSANNVFNTINLGVKDTYGQDVRISDVFGNLANLVGSDPGVNLALVRSMVHGNGAHANAQRYMNRYWEGAPATLYPSTASVMAHFYEGAGLGIPSVVLTGANGDGANVARGSRVPTALSVNPAASGQNPVVKALERPAGVDDARYRRRQLVIERMNKRFLKKRTDAVAKAYDKATADAADLTLKGLAPQAFDLTGVPLVTARDNGTAVRLTQACRLVEFGVPYVACGIGGNDTHSNNMATIQGNWGQSVNQGVVEVVNRLKATGKRVLIIMSGEFGRTPASVKDGRDGRDHWPDGFSTAFLGVNQPKMKTTAIGNTGPDGMWRERDGNLVDPIHPKDIGAFVYRSLGFDVGSNTTFHIPLSDRDASPVDRVNEGTKLLTAFGLL